MTNRGPDQTEQRQNLGQTQHTPTKPTLGQTEQTQDNGPTQQTKG